MNYAAPVTPLFPPLPPADEHTPVEPPSSGGVLEALLQSPKFRELLSPERGGNVIDLLRSNSHSDSDSDSDEFDIDVSDEHSSELGSIVDRALACR